MFDNQKAYEVGSASAIFAVFYYVAGDMELI